MRITIEWETLHANSMCKSRANVVPCYGYNKKNELIDLNPLVYTEGFSYHTDSNDEVQFSVCSNIKEGVCNKFASCNIKDKDKPVNLGILKDGVSLDDDESMTIIYKTDDSETKITFRCPKDINYLGRKVKLMNVIDKKFHFELLTEYACPLKDQIVHETDSLTKEKNGVDFDLKVFGK